VLVIEFDARNISIFMGDQTAKLSLALVALKKLT
jgi:hypothetical protein